MSSSAEGAPAAVLNDSSIAKQSEASLPALASPSKKRRAVHAAQAPIRCAAHRHGNCEMSE